MNIIVMAMSTLTLPNTTDISKRILKPSKYRNGKGKEEIEYYSQMEPACRKILEENPAGRTLLLKPERSYDRRSMVSRIPVCEKSAGAGMIKNENRAVDK